MKKNLVLKGKKAEIAKLLLFHDDKAAHIRGAYIQAVSSLEYLIDMAISRYFCPVDYDKQDEFLYSILSSDKMTLSNKHQIFCFIAQRHCKDVYNKHYGLPTKKERKLNPEYKTLGYRMETILSTRNKLAHRQHKIIEWDSELNSTTKIYFDTKTPKGGELKNSELRISDEEMNLMISEVYQVHECFVEIYESLIKHIEKK